MDYRHLSDEEVDDLSRLMASIQRQLDAIAARRAQPDHDLPTR